MEEIDTELAQLNISEQLRANSSFMKIMATLFHYGNQSMNAAQLVIAVRALNLLPLRGETPKSTVQGIISTSRKAARDLRQTDPFHIEKDGSGRQAKYSIADSVLNGASVPEKLEIPDEPIILKPVEHPSSYSGGLGKRHRKSPKFYSPDERARRKAKHRRARAAKLRKRQGYDGETDVSDIDVTDNESDFGSSSEGDDSREPPPEEDTIYDYSLLVSPPPLNMDYIDPINFSSYPIASYFAIVQQKGYSYPRFRSHEKVKIPKVHCEDKYRVADIKHPITSAIIGRMFILADGHGGPGCSEFFVRQVPHAVQKVCASYDPTDFGTKEIQKRFESDVKAMVTDLDEEYLDLKRKQLKLHTTPPGEDVDMDGNSEVATEFDNDGCTLIINIFFGSWLVNINVGDSRSVLISAREPTIHTPTLNDNVVPPSPASGGADLDYKMDVVFASQDHKPYLEHLAREILENGGEFVDSVQNRVIKVELDKLREDGNRNSKRLALKNARIRPKGYQAGRDQPNGDSPQGWTTQSAVRTTANQSLVKQRTTEDRIPSLNVARSCGDLDFKMDAARKIISCEPDVTFIRISDNSTVCEANGDEPPRTIVTSEPHKGKRRHFLFMSTDGTFDYMYEETAQMQNRAIAKAIGPMIEDGEKMGSYLFEEDQQLLGQTIEHSPADKTDASGEAQGAAPNEDKEDTDMIPVDEEGESAIAHAGQNENDDEATDEKKKEEESEEGDHKNGDSDTKGGQDNDKVETDHEKEELPRKPLLFRELSEQEAKARKIKEKTLVMTARYFANRESAHGFYSSTLQDYDDCTIMLIEI